MSNLDVYEKQGRKRIAGRHLFSFAIVADTHVRSPQDAPSPWATNELALSRMQDSYRHLGQIPFQFIMHLGDMVNPVPHLPTYASAGEAALDVVRSVPLKTHFVPGNHDVGDKVSHVERNHPIDDYSLERYEEQYGRSFYSFDHEAIHFVVINSSLLGSGLEQEAAQFDWLERDLSHNAGKRIFLFMHYPPYIYEPEEPAIYDNVEIEPRRIVLELFRKYSVEAVFCGHIHNYTYNRFHASEVYTLPSTTFYRQDYSVMFAADPGEEFGRNDTGKLGWGQVDVFEDGHILHIHRTSREKSANRIGHNVPAGQVSTHPKSSMIGNLGVHLREPWADALAIPYAGPQDEFERRRVRNDYTLLALSEAGFRQLRVPLRDLGNDAYRQRMRDLSDIGHGFFFFHADFPDDRLLGLLDAYEGSVSGLEIIVPWKEEDSYVQRMNTLDARLPNKKSVPRFVTPISSPMDHRQREYQFGYYMNFGFDVSERKTVEAHSRAHPSLGYTFRIDPLQSPLVVGHTVLANFQDDAPSLSFNVSSFGGKSYSLDHLAAASRYAQAILLSYLFPQAHVFIDTLIDVVRGYSPRAGLYDGLYNPNLAGEVAINLHAVLRQFNNLRFVGSEEDSEFVACTCRADGQSLVVFVFPKQAMAFQSVKRFVPIELKDAGLLSLADLGEIPIDTNRDINAPFIVKATHAVAFGQ
jgi:3',5'-cyclic AMP phosphodiesterase CpdA